MGACWPQSQQPKPGDLIEISQVGYQHWAVYVGDGDVVHLTSSPCADVSGAASSSLMSVSTERAMVRKQKLKEAVGHSKWKINNILDKNKKPRSAHIIVEEALGQVGNVIDYSIISNNCGHFATKLRYGEAVSIQSDETIKPGDLVEIFRGAYKHWTVYVGDGDVVHVTSPPDADVLGAAWGSLMSVSTEKAMVRKQKLEEVVGRNTWKINNILDKNKKPRTADDIVEEALGQVGKVIDYSVISNNCGHFATKLRYGEAVYIQGIMGAVARASFSGSGLLPTTQAESEHS